MKLGKKDYAQTLDISKKKTGVQALIEDHEAWLKSKKRKNPRRDKGDGSIQKKTSP
jgi:ATP-dependent RNA helicase RhlE